MTQLLLGHTVAEPRRSVRLDLGRLVESRLLLQANSGGGKSWALRRLLEQSHGQIQHLVLDIEGEFHTLRERFDYVLAARTGADTLADPRAAPLLARRLLELGVSAICDLYELKAHERIRFVRLFLEALIDAPRSLWHPVLVVVDEAHHFCPQKGDAESAGAVIDLMTRGRKRGFCGVLATQRLSKLHKDAAAEANVKLIGRAALDVDMQRAAEELGISSKEDRLRLRTLPTGTFFAFGPGLSDQVVEVLVGDVQTTHPRPGQRAAPIPPAREKVQKVLAQLADLPKEAEAEARTAAELRGEVATLKRQLAAAAKAAPPAPAPPPAKEVSVLKDSHVRGLEREVGRLEKAAGSMVAAAAVINAQANDLRHALAIARVPSARSSTPPLPPAPRAAPQGGLIRAAPRESRPRPVAAHGGARGPGLSKAQRLALAALAQYPGGRTKVQVAILAGYAHNGGGFNNALSALRSRGYIEGSEPLRITPTGTEALGPFEPMPTGAALFEHWRARLGKAERAALAELVAAYPEALSKEDLGARAGYEPNGGGFNNALSKLRTLELIQGRGELRASEDLFG